MEDDGPEDRQPYKVRNASGTTYWYRPDQIVAVGEAPSAGASNKPGGGKGPKGAGRGDGKGIRQLADEYEYAGNTYSGPEPSSPNITTSPTGQKWSLWHGTQGISL